MKKLGIGTMAFLVAVSTVLSTAKITTLATDVTKHNIVSVEKGKDTLEIGNESLSRVFSYEENVLKTDVIKNLRANLDFVPGQGSEEFTINTVETSELDAPSALSRVGWTAEASSRQNATGEADGPASNLLDDKLGSIWHTNYGGGVGPLEYPHDVVFDLQKETSFKAFAYTPRQEGIEVNGNISGYELYVSTTKEGLNDPQSLAAKGTFAYNGVKPIYVNLNEEHTGRYVKFVATSSKNGQKFAGGSEFNLYADKVASADPSRYMLKASDLTLKKDDIKVEDTAAVINKVQKQGKKVTFPFEAYTLNGVTYEINEVVVMYNGDSYLRKFMEISIPDETQYEKAKIDYIDCEHMVVNEADTTWTLPDKGGISLANMSANTASLGQPVYIQGMYFGSEFPTAQTKIDADQVARMRYYSGKSFAKLAAENELSDDGKLVTWQTVAGAARSDEYRIIQQDFYEYIEDISQPSEFRTQYNSWYDNMMYINNDNIRNTFLDMEKGLTQSGLAPMESYVVDDGWNNYNNAVRAPGTELARASGTTKNKTGFWEFNDKFPDGFTTASNLVKSLGSSFGVWLGPRGGYNGQTGSFGQIIQNAETGYYNAQSNDIDVASHKYIKKLGEFFLDQQNLNQINYWKLDGFSQYPCTNSTHDHMVGGADNMYYYTDMWEQYIHVFDALLKNADKQEIDNYWISLTCFVQPSPWFLQWAKSIWLQSSYDLGRIDAGDNVSDDLNQILTFRDQVYYEMVEERQVQLPINRYYNHDPIYGVEGSYLAKNVLNDEQYEAYMYMMGTRGTDFWELYYSPSMMEEGTKWEINADFLKWVEEKHHILSNAKMIGNDPGTITGGGAHYAAHVGTGDIYGYVSWDDLEGVISMRNGANTAKTMTFTLDEKMGMSPKAKDLVRTTKVAYNTSDESTGEDAYKTLSYGDEITVTLQPGELRIWEVNPEADTTAPIRQEAYMKDDQTLTLKYNEPVKEADISIEGQAIIKTTIRGDHRTIDVQLAKPLEEEAVLKVSVYEIKDMAGNQADKETMLIDYYVGNKVIAVEEEKAIVQAMEAQSDKGVAANEPFTVTAKVKTTASNVNVIKQEGAYQLYINEDGYAVFALNGRTAVSKEKVNTNEYVTLTGVLEYNGMIKIYVNGSINASDYQGKMDAAAFAPSKTILGDIDFGTMKEISVYMTALGYDDIALVHEGTYQPSEPNVPEDQVVNIAEGKTVTGGWSRSSQTAEFKVFQPLSGIADGKINCVAPNFADYGNDSVDDSAYIQIDLGAVYDISSFNLYRYWLDGRTYRGTVLAVSNHADFDDSMIVYNSDADNKHGFGAGSDATYAETDAGKKISLEDPVSARYVRIYMHGSNKGNTNHVVELEVMGKKVTSELDYTELYESIVKVQSIQREDYTVNSLKALKAALSKATEIYNTAETQEQIIQVSAELENAYNELVSYKDLKSELENVKALNEKDYTTASWAILQTAVENAEAVLDNEAATKEDVAEAVSKIQTAMDSLAMNSSLAKAILGNAIAKADGLVASDAFMLLAPAVKDNITAALADAKAVYAAEVSDEVYLQAWLKLADSMHYLSFEADKRNLELLIAECEGIQLGDYTIGVENFVKALLEAKVVYHEDVALKDRINTAYSNLYNAKNALAKGESGDKATLQAAMDMMKEVVGDGSKYRKNDAWKKYQEALLTAETTIADVKATQAQINQAMTILASAYEDLRLMPDESLLKDLEAFVAMIDALDLDRFNAEQRTFIMSVRDDAATALANIDQMSDGALLEIQLKVSQAREMMENIELEIPESLVKPADQGDVKAPEKEVKATANNTTKTGDTTNAATAATLVILSGAALLALKRRKR